MAAAAPSPTASPVSHAGPLLTPAGTALAPQVALATSMHASPGVYALLLGSGVSTGAGVKTGWGIVQDLVRRAAAAQDADNLSASDGAARDPEAWWREHCDGELGYSDLLGMLAPAPISLRGTSKPMTTIGKQASDCQARHTRRSRSWCCAAAFG
ncbi:hypothetical protein [Streptomyces deccanensis]|uniref:hypothetical protein n=1 Tax=Streptomyces deccanensis TaxID=424188 RepID=UPI001EFAEDAC|nr:hypothetical protein [Streptomyces deccanensis]ULR48393.1 hypothetical protein L3078_03340 [Streptomyces deccanensis]